jgi:hypothetical protein
MGKEVDLVKFVAFVNEVFADSVFENENTLLLSIPFWDSMSQLVIAAWIHQETGNVVSVEALKSAKTIGDLKAIYDARL